MRTLSGRRPFVDPRTGAPLEERQNVLVNSHTGETVAEIKDGIARFVSVEENYAESFGWQWKTWADARSDVRNPGHNLRDVILARTQFANLELDGATLLECGMGGGDDTEVLLQLPFSKVHAFDISTSVERAHKYLSDSRLTISQASIYDIPYPDRVFDIVYCHRVLQHTPDPIAALRAICKKVKPGGFLFAHSYKRSWLYMNEWRYKYRWLTKRLSPELMYRYVMNAGPYLHRIANAAYRMPVLRECAYSLLPFYHVSAREFPELSEEQRLEMAQHVTFDALTPWHDHPMRPRTFRSVLESEGFAIVHWHEHRASPMYCTAVYDRSGDS